MDKVVIAVCVEDSRFVHLKEERVSSEAARALHGRYPELREHDENIPGAIASEVLVFFVEEARAHRHRADQTGLESTIT